MKVVGHGSVQNTAPFRVERTPFILGTVVYWAVWSLLVAGWMLHSGVASAARVRGAPA